ncbi:cleavage and polyadenylation specificity factor subunit 3 [Enteropsectra breve]|nr:cleavage and polyadenylation specificity factor subunit 3 [Enteropsectra breve]
MEQCSTIVLKPLGAGNEVGRSCIHLKYGEKELLLDCGVHPAFTGVSALPFLDLVDLSKISAILVTHFHLDHAAALPFLTEKTAFKGKVYMTHPTKAILKWLLNDYIRVINSASEQDFYSEEDLANCYQKITPIDYHEMFEIEGIKVTALNAGHVLGAAMFLIEVENSKILYTGDFSREEDRHLKGAESPGCALHALITESTYGVQCHLPRVEREARFTSVVSEIVERGGRCLLPVFALGRAQELLLILEEHWRRNAQLQNIPIYYVSALAKKCMGVYQTYINMMNDRMQKIYQTRNPFDFEYVKNLKDAGSFRDTGPCVMMASPGMLQSGFSRELFEKWCTNAKNGTVLSGYSVEGTLAREILSEPSEVESTRGKTLKLNMSVEYISFSAHVDFIQNSQFIEECQPQNVFFVHGEVNEMMRLKNTIAQKNEKNGIQMNLFALKNGEEGAFPVEKTCEAQLYTENTEQFEALLIADENKRVYDVEHLEESGFQKYKIFHKQNIPFNSKFALLKHILVMEYDAVQNTSDSAKLDVGGILVEYKDDTVFLEWESSYVKDVIALAINKSIADIGASVKDIKTSKMGYLETVCSVLKEYYKNVERSESAVVVTIHGKIVKITSNGVEGEDKDISEKIEDIVNKVKQIF